MHDPALKVVTVSTIRVQSGNDQVVTEPSEAFVSSPSVAQLTDRALTYLQAGYAVHFAGPAGTGKTTLAFHVAAKLGRPISLIHGDDEFNGSDLVGRDSGYRKNKLVDRYIHSVIKTEEEMKSLWVDSRLTTACQNGYTLIYDEFNRSRAEANNALLSILSERILNLPKLRRTGDGYLEVHPEFHAIFTSNPEEYAGVHRTQDALLDRLLTMHLQHYDRETEIQITRAKSGIGPADAETIVDIVRELRSVGVNHHRPTIRACIAMAKVLVIRGSHARWEDAFFQSVWRDILSTDTARVIRDEQTVIIPQVEDVIRKVCAEPKPAA